MDNLKRTLEKSGVFLYVYETLGVKYNPIKKRIESNRELVGKIKDGKFIPNKKYFIWHDEKLPNDRSDFIKTGTYILLDHLVSKTFELKKLLEDIFKDKALDILDIAAYMIIKGTDVMQHIDGHFYDHPSFREKPFDDDHISRLLSSLKYRDIDLFC